MNILKIGTKKALRFLYQSMEMSVSVADLESNNNCFAEIGEAETALTVIRVSSAHLPLIRGAFGEKIVEKFENRQAYATGYLICYKAETVGYFWGSSSVVRKEGNLRFHFDITPKPGVIYFYDGFILTQWRGMGIMTAAIARFFVLLKENGRKKAFTLFLKNNRGSKQMAHKLGMETIGAVRFQILFGRKRADLSALGELCELNA
jgi:hypothetical protein